MELIIPLTGQEEIPLYEQIYQYIKEEIRNKNLPAGVKLPSTRVLAENLKVSRSTSQMAYEQLASEGYIEAVACRGYFVAEIEELVQLAPGKTAASPWEDEEEDGERRFQVDFSPRGIDLGSFPFFTWRKISKDTLVDHQKELFRTGDPQGEFSLREAIREYLHGARGVCCRRDQIIVGAGSEYLLMLLARLLGDEKVIAMENPTYRQAYRVLCSLGYQVRPISMDRSGLVVEELEECGADVAYVMPSHQYPTGIVMPIKRRQELLAWAARGWGRYIIEDDYDSEFRYKGKPIPSLQGIDKEGRVIYIGTFSKSIAPAIRIGYMVLPEELLAQYRSKFGFYASTVSRIDQNILSQFIKGGYYERHLNRMRAIYKSKHDILLAAVKPLEENFSVDGEYAGLHVLLTHRGGRDERWLAARAADGGVKVYGLSGYFIGDEAGQMEVTSSTVLLGFANLTEEEIRKGVGLLVNVWKEED